MLVCKNSVIYYSYLYDCMIHFYGPITVDQRTGELSCLTNVENLRINRENQMAALIMSLKQEFRKFLGSYLVSF